MRKLFLCLSVLGMMLTGCSKNDDGESDNPNNNGNEQPENPNEPKLPELPALPDPDDVCSAMDDINFMAYCYENFDVNKDGKVSVNEANAVRDINVNNQKILSLKGIERFPNIERISGLNSPQITELDLRYNLKLQSFNCFGNKKLITVLLPNTLTSIGQSAFYSCSNLTEIHLPASLTSIGDSAFRCCDNLTEINFPDNLTSVGIYAFWNCYSLTKVACHALVPPELNGGYSFSGQYIENLYVPAESIQAYKDSPWARSFKNILPIE